EVDALHKKRSPGTLSLTALTPATLGGASQPSCQGTKRLHELGPTEHRSKRSCREKRTVRFCRISCFCFLCLLYSDRSAFGPSLCECWPARRGLVASAVNWRTSAARSIGDGICFGSSSASFWQHACSD